MVRAIRSVAQIVRVPLDLTRPAQISNYNAGLADLLGIGDDVREVLDAALSVRVLEDDPADIFV